MGDRQQLRALHDSYVWEVNAAVGAGRLDLVRELSDQFLDQALELLVGGEETTCGETDCAVCNRSRPAVAVPRRRRWSRRARGSAAG